MAFGLGGDVPEGLRGQLDSRTLVLPGQGASLRPPARTVEGRGPGRPAGHESQVSDIGDEAGRVPPSPLGLPTPHVDGSQISPTI